MPLSNFPREKILPRQIGMIYNLLSVTKTNYKQKTLILKKKLSFSFCVQCKKNYMKTPEVGNLGKRHVFGFASSDTTLRLSEFALPSSSSPLFGPQSGGAMVFAPHCYCALFSWPCATWRVGAKVANSLCAIQKMLRTWFFMSNVFSSGAKRIRVTFISHHDSRPRIFTSGPALLFGPCANDAVARARWQEKWCERPAQVNT